MVNLMGLAPHISSKFAIHYFVGFLRYCQACVATRMLRPFKVAGFTLGWDGFGILFLGRHGLVPCLGLLASFVIFVTASARQTFVCG